MGGVQLVYFVCDLDVGLVNIIGLVFGECDLEVGVIYFVIIVQGWDVGIYVCYDGQVYQLVQVVGVID